MSNRSFLISSQAPSRAQKSAEQIKMGAELREQLEGHRNNLTVCRDDGKREKIVFDRARVTELIQKGADLEQYYSGGCQTPLGIAAHENLLEIAAELLAAGASIRGVAGSVNPIVIAAERGNIEIMHMLVAAAKEQGIDIRQDLGAAMRSCDYNAKMQKVLLGYDADRDLSVKNIKDILRNPLWQDRDGKAEPYIKAVIKTMTPVLAQKTTALKAKIAFRQEAQRQARKKELADRQYIEDGMPLVSDVRTIKPPRFGIK